MNARRVFLWAALSLWIVATIVPCVASAEARRLSLAQALALARRHNSAVLAARARGGGFAGELAAASAWQALNPELSTAARPRGNEGLELEVDLSQWIEIGGARSARIARARARIAGAEGSAAATLNESLREVAESHFRLAAGQERQAVALANGELTREVVRVARARYEAGDVPVLDVNVAAVADVAAQADIARRAAELVVESGRLCALLGLPPGTVLVADDALAHRPSHQLTELIERGKRRPELRVLAARIDEAKAEEALGQTRRLPSFGVSVGYGREDGEGAPQAGLAVSLPVFDRGEAETQRGAAEARAVAYELDGLARTIEAQIRAAYAAYEHLARAAEDFAAEALPRIDENLALARRSYEAGNLALGDLLSIQRASIDARHDLIELRLDASLAAVNVSALAGTLAQEGGDDDR